MNKTKLELTKQIIKNGLGTAEDFEYLIKNEGLTMFNIALISEYYKDDLQDKDLIQEVEIFFH